MVHPEDRGIIDNHAPHLQGLKGLPGVGQIFRKDPGLEPVGRIVGQLQSLGKILKGRQHRHRAEDFLIPDLQVPAHLLQDHGRDEIARAGVAGHHARPAVSGLLDPLPDLGRGRGIDHGPDDRFFFARVPRVDFPLNGRQKNLLERLIDLPVHQQPLHRDAHLPGMGV